MRANAIRALRALVVLSILTGLLYPLAITGVSQLFLGTEADGSLLEVGGRSLGSRQIGQLWEGDQWFYGRPSSVDYDASTSSGSNLGPSSAELSALFEERIAAILDLESPYTADLQPGDIPADLVTASSSGLDPHISPEAARFQAPRVADIREIPVNRLLSLIEEHTQGPTLGFLGRPRVNVLELNLALNRMAER